MLPRCPSPLPKRPTQADQLRLSRRSVCCELSHIGGPLRTRTEDHGLLMLHLLLHKRPRCQAGTRGLIALISPSLTALLSEMLTSSGPPASCSDASICCSGSSKRLHIGHQCSATHIHLQGGQENLPHVASSSPCCLAGQRGTRCLQAFSVLSGEPSTASQSSTGTHLGGSWPHGTTCYVVAAGFLHPVESPALLPAGYPATSSVEPQASLPAGYPVHYTSCIADPAHDTSCLTVYTVH